jgi:hypothetical protein
VGAEPESAHVGAELAKDESAPVGSRFIRSLVPVRSKGQSRELEEE